MRFTILFFALLAQTAFAQFGHDNFDAGSISAKAECGTLTITETQPPREKERYEIHSCRIEAIIDGQMQILGYGCDTVLSFPVPAEPPYQIRRRVFWHGGPGTAWRTTAEVHIDSEDCPSIAGDNTMPGAELSGGILTATGSGVLIILRPPDFSLLALEEFTGGIEYDLNDLGTVYVYLLYNNPYHEIHFGIIGI